MHPAHLRVTLTILALALLAACATPLQKCVNDAQRQHKALITAIATAQGNLDRGYAIHRQRVPYTYWGYCHNAYGHSYFCPKTRTRLVETPVRIDLDEERKKLTALKRQLPATQRRADDAIGQCHALYPE